MDLNPFFTFFPFFFKTFLVFLRTLGLVEGGAGDDPEESWATTPVAGQELDKVLVDECTFEPELKVAAETFTAGAVAVPLAIGRAITAGVSQAIGRAITLVESLVVSLLLLLFVDFVNFGPFLYIASMDFNFNPFFFKAFLAAGGGHILVVL